MRDTLQMSCHSRQKIACLSLMAACLLQPAQASAEPIRGAILQSWIMPLADMPNGAPQRGLIPDLYRLIAAESQTPINLITLPRARIDLALDKAQVDILCYASPNWLNAPYQFIWSLPFMTQRDLLVGREHYPGFNGIESLSGTKLGTVLGYHYPSLQGLLDNGELQRVDSRSQHQVLEMLRARRLDYGISNELSLHWLNRQSPAKPALIALQTVQEEAIACLVRDDPKVPSQKILRAMVRLQQRGEFEALLQHYR